MRIYGLKTRIIINIGIITLLAALLTDVVLISMVRRDLIKIKIDHGNFILELIKKKVENTENNLKSAYPAAISEVENIIAINGIKYAVILAMDNGKQRYGGNVDHSNIKRLERYAEKTRESGKKQIDFKGNIFGIFRKQNQHVILSTPLKNNGVITGAAAILVPVEGIYRQIRSSQKILWIYIILNTGILSLIGFYRIYHIQIKPIQRLVKIAQDYREDDEIYFSVRKGDDKLHQLSTALNSMLKKNAEGREKLHMTVRSLEKAKLELESAQTDIIRAEKLASVGRLSSGIAHEIGNPVGIVIGYLELLKEKGISRDQRKDYILRAETEVNRINTIIKQLLDISRTSKAEIKSISVHEVINDIYAVLKVQPLMLDIQIEKSLKAEKNIIESDANRLRQVFLNLAINAADAISSKGDNHAGKLKIASKVVYDDTIEMLKISFIDNGPGIPNDKINDIFDPFYTTKEPGKGTGLGLYVSFMIVESLGGHIKVSSEPGKETEISIYLPFKGKAAGTAIAG